MTDLAELIERLENGFDADRELDALVYCAADSEFTPHVNGMIQEVGGAHQISVAPRFTDKLDETFFLLGWAVKDWEWETTNLYGVSRVTLYVEQEGPFYGSCEAGEEPSRTCRALLAALLRALQAKADQ
mgnify:CR=1 FL=1